MKKPISPSYFSLYIDGINQLPSMYKLDSTYPTIVTLTQLVSIGSKVTVYLRRYQPTTAELAFNPAVKDVPNNMVKYRYDYQYVVQPIRNSSGAITGNTYYFWVQNKAIPYGKNLINCKEASSLLRSGPTLYLTFQDMRIISDDGYDRQIDRRTGGETIKFFDLTRFEINSLTSLTMIYKAITIANLGTYVTKDNTYKLRFTRDFTLRNDPNELDLKNTHTEWSLIRPNSRTLIPASLWELVVDSACGINVLGESLPSSILIDYDKRHGTKTRFGFNKNQILIDTYQVRNSLIQAILNPKTTKWLNGQYVPDMINSIDYTNASNWFSTPTSTRSLLTNIWNTASAIQINGIFFEVLNDALSNDYEFSELFKSSMLSVHSIISNYS
jgi:hypothetical protein